MMIHLDHIYSSAIASQCSQTKPCLIINPLTWVAFFVLFVQLEKESKMCERRKMDSFAGWASLPDGVVDLISTKLKTIADYVRFRAVCRAWRSTTPPKPRCCLPAHPPWLMIAWNPKDQEDKGSRLFYDHWESKMHKLHLPETICKVCLVSHDGWLLLAATKGEQVLLLNPLTRARIDLPPLVDWDVIDVDNMESYDFTHGGKCSYPDSGFKMVFSTNLSDPDCLITLFSLDSQMILCCTVGDACWTRVNNPWKHNVLDVTCYNGRLFLLYAKTATGAMTVIDLSNPGERIVHRLKYQWGSPLLNLHFLEGKPGVYIVAVYEKRPAWEGLQKVEIFQFDEQSSKLQQVANSDNTVIFVTADRQYLAVCSDDWDFLRGGSLYNQFMDVPFAAGYAAMRVTYDIYFSMIDDVEHTELVATVGKHLLYGYEPPARWFQPSIV